MAKNKLVADLVQWVLILSLSGMCLLLYLNGQSIIENANLHKLENKILIGKNERLTDSINFMRINKPLTIVKYRLIHNGDTIYIDRKLAPLDDTIYDFTEKKGALNYQIKIKAKNINA